MLGLKLKHIVKGTPGHYSVVVCLKNLYHRTPSDYLDCYRVISLQWHRNGHNGFSNRQPYDCLLNRLFGCRSNKTSKLRVTGLWAGNSPWTGVNSPHKGPIKRKCFHLMTSSCWVLFPVIILSSRCVPYAGYIIVSLLYSVQACYNQRHQIQNVILACEIKTHATSL